MRPSRTILTSGLVGRVNCMATSASSRSTSADRIAQARSMPSRGYARWNSTSRGPSQNVPNASVTPRRTSPDISGTARSRARTRPNAASSILLAASRISSPSAVVRMPSTCRVTRMVPSARSRSSTLRRSASGDINLSQRSVVFSATAADIDDLVPRARREMGGGASNEVVQSVARHNPDSIWGVARREKYSAGNTAAEGYVAFLMLNEEGADRLMTGRLHGKNPPLSLLARQHEKPAAIYVWGIYAPGALAGGVPLAFEKVWTPLYRKAPLLARPVTAAGHRLLDSLGFDRGAIFKGKIAAHLHMYPRGKSA